MKQLKYYAMAFVAVMAMAVFYACGDDDDKSSAGGSNSLVGTWVQNAGSNRQETVVFNSDGTGTWQERLGGKLERFSYTISGQDVVIRWIENYSGSGVELYRWVISDNGQTLMLYEYDDDEDSGLELEFMGTRQSGNNGNSNANNGQNNNNGNLSAQALVGTWMEAKSSDEYEIFVINANGTGVRTMTYGRQTYSVQFTWSLSGEYLYVTVTEDYSGSYTFTYKVALIDGGRTMLVYERDSYSGWDLEWTLTKQ